MKLFDTPLADDGLSRGKHVILGIQHTFTMFGATVLVPILTGMNVSVALFMVGIGTIIFHLITKGKVPAFMGSSFAFIVPMQLAIQKFGLAQAQGGLVFAGVGYLLFSLLIYLIGSKKIMSFFPPVVTGPMIMVIGLTLAPTALDMAKQHWGLALISFSIVVFINLFTTGFIQVLPVLLGLAGGYIVAILTGNVDFTPVAEALWFGLPAFTRAEFSLEAILSVAPVVIVVMVEHVGDIVAISATVGEDLVTDPGLHRTTLGDGLAVIISAMFGGPANTTYSENTGVLALTKVFNPVVMRIAAYFAILLSVVPKFGAIISSIPGAVIGGISIILFGMISSIGARTLVENQVDFQNSRNLIIAAVILVLGLGFASEGILLSLGEYQFEISGMALAAVSGIILNKLLPENNPALKKSATN